MDFCGVKKYASHSPRAPDRQNMVFDLDVWYVLGLGFWLLFVVDRHKSYTGRQLVCGARLCDCSECVPHSDHHDPRGFNRSIAGAFLVRGECNNSTFHTYAGYWLLVRYRTLFPKTDYTIRRRLINYHPVSAVIAGKCGDVNKKANINSFLKISCCFLLKF